MSAKTPTPDTQPTTPYARLECGFCGRKCGAYLGHYDLVRCDCGVAFWALRPERDGPLVFFPWPGRTLEEAAMIKARAGQRRMAR